MDKDTAYICFDNEGRGRFRGHTPCTNLEHVQLTVRVLDRRDSASWPPPRDQDEQPK